MEKLPPPEANDGEHDDLAALDFSAADGDTDESGLDTLPGLVDTPDGGDADNDGLGDEVAEPSPVFTVTNPPGTVTVSTFIDGRVRHIDLSPTATTMTETHLAEEIVVIADLATQDARSGQYAFMLEEMREHGHDNAATRDFLARDLNLPSPEQVRAARAAIFETRYAGHHE